MNTSPPLNSVDEKNMRKLFFIIIALLSNNTFAACDSTTSANGANFGFYTYDGTNNNWVLVDSFYETHATTEPMKTGDIYRPLSLYQPPSGGGGGQQQQKVQTNASSTSSTTAGCDPITLPPVEVVGVRPTQTSSVIMLRYIPRNLGGGSGSFNRQSVGGIRQGNNAYTCQNSSEMDRQAAALAALPSIVAAQSVWLVRYAPGHFQMWVVTVPTFTDRGLKPFGRCVGG